VRSRVAFAFARFLPYITGGWAFGGKHGGVTGTYVKDKRPDPPAASASRMLTCPSNARYALTLISAASEFV